MKVVHIESGLGNQMLSFCEYLTLKQNTPNDDIYIETIVFDIPECDDIVCQWNGFELKRVFGIDVDNVQQLFSEDKWESIICDVRKTEFWKKNWNYPVYITNVLNKYGLKLVNIRGDFEREKRQDGFRSIVSKIRHAFFFNTWVGVTIKRYITFNSYRCINKASNLENLHCSCDNIFTGQWLSYKFNGNKIEMIQSLISKYFVFPPFTDAKNEAFSQMLSNTNSVFIHARRGDMLSANGWCYKFGYFKRAIKYIKKHVENPVFVFFTNSGSVEWCRQHAASIFGLVVTKDVIEYVDWNSGENSYRDMQLMSFCKHGIITNSTFGWWGAYFIKNPNKITISPMAEINTTHHC